MKKTIIVTLALLTLAGCQKTYNVIPYESGINEVNYTHRNSNKALIVSLEWAQGYCNQRGKDFKVVERNQQYRKGLVSKKADKNITMGENVAGAVGHVPFMGGVADAIGGRTREKLLFRCVKRE